MIDNAALLCRLAHVLQDDKCGVPYWKHPYSVASKVGEKEKPAAYLHDVLEDTPLTENDLLRYGFGSETVEAVSALTKREGEPYQAYIGRLSSCPIAVEVKIADLRHNLSPSRTGATQSMRARYLAALSVLEEAEERD